MKSSHLPLILCLLVACRAPGAVILSQSFSGGAIPEGDPVGQVFTGTFNLANAGDLVQDLTVDVNLTGGYNGDFYAALMAPNGTVTELFNQPGTSVNGFGAGGAGMNITLSDAANRPIQQETSNSLLTGTYRPAFTLGSQNASPANGQWEIYFASLGTGGRDATLNSWSLGIAVVPEPVLPALGVFGGCLLVGMLLGRRSKTRRA